MTSISCFSQNYLYNKGGISLSYDVDTVKSFYCDNSGRNVYFVKVRWQLNNDSGKSARIYYGMTLPNPSVSWCTAQGVYDEVTQTYYQPSGTGFGGAVILESGDSSYGENAGWYFNENISPGWAISKIDFN